MLELKATSPTQMDQKEAVGHQALALINDINILCLACIDKINNYPVKLCKILPDTYTRPQVAKAYYKSLYGFKIGLLISFFSFEKLQ